MFDDADASIDLQNGLFHSCDVFDTMPSEACLQFLIRHLFLPHTPLDDAAVMDKERRVVLSEFPEGGKMIINQVEQIIEHQDTEHHE